MEDVIVSYNGVCPSAVGSWMMLGSCSMLQPEAVLQEVLL